MPAHARFSFAMLITGSLLCLFAVSQVQPASAAGAELELPDCNAEQPETKLIRTEADWSSVLPSSSSIQMQSMYLQHR